MEAISPAQARLIASAWETLSNALRQHVEARLRMKELLKVDKEDAVTNLDGAFENILEKFHTLYDVTNQLPMFNYFEQTPPWSSSCAMQCITATTSYSLAGTQQSG